MSQSCRFFNTITGCRYGNQCRYSHDISQHDIPLCRYFNSATGCRYGSQCRYKHETVTNNNINDVDEKSNFDNDLQQKLKLLKQNMATSYGKKTIQKYHEFYKPLDLDYEAMTEYVDSARTYFAEEWKIKGNQMYSNKQYIKAIQYYQKAIVLLDCTYFKNQNKKEMNDLLFVILSNTSQCWLSYAESVKNKRTEKDKYIIYLLYALNNIQMSLWINHSESNFKALYRKIVCLYRLGLVKYGDILIQQLKDLKSDKMTNILIQKLEKEKLNNKQEINIQKYLKLMGKLGIASELDELIDIEEHEWNALNLQCLLLSVSELVRMQKWSISNCISWLKNFVEDVIDQSMYYEVLPRELYDESEYDQFRSYCFTVIMTVLSIEPLEIAKYFDEYVGYKSADDWEYFSNQIKYLQIKNKCMWFCEQRFWSQIVETILSIKHYDDDINEAIRKQTLLYVEINNEDQRHLKWKTFYMQHKYDEQDEENKDKKTNMLPSDGRLNKLPKYDFVKGNSMELGQEDLLNIHAIASLRKNLKVIQEIEQMTPHNLYYMGFTWLHEFAKDGCYNACEFVISLGMDVNVIDRLKYGGKRRYWYQEPVTPIDYILKQFKENNVYYPVTREMEEKLVITAMTLRKLGGKRYCELKNKKGDYKETKIFEKIMNGLNINDYDENDDDESDDEEYGYNGIPQYMCDELLCQGIKPWDDDAMAALSVLYDFD